MSTRTSEPSLPSRTLGRTGIAVPAIGIGCWPIGGPDHNLGMPMGWSSGKNESAALAGLETAWQLGARLFDTADVYGHGLSERRIRHLVAQVPRKDIVLSSKVGYFSGTAPHGFDPGHMRRQLEQTLANLGTDHLDIYALHHTEFGPDDILLEPAIKTMRAFRAEGLIRAIGMRGPHRFAPERLSTPAELRGDKIARFQAVFHALQPDVLAVRDNLLTPYESTEGVFAFAQTYGCGVLVNKPLSQGLLTGTYDPDLPRLFGEGDHRTRKRWFTPSELRIINDGLHHVQSVVGKGTSALVHIALWSCLQRSESAAVLVGFTSPEQVRINLASLGSEPPARITQQVRTIMARVQKQLDASGQVFVDERAARGRPETPS